MRPDNSFFIAGNNSYIARHRARKLLPYLRDYKHHPKWYSQQIFQWTQEGVHAHDITGWPD